MNYWHAFGHLECLWSPLLLGFRKRSHKQPWHGHLALLRTCCYDDKLHPINQGQMKKWYNDRGQKEHQSRCMPLETWGDEPMESPCSRKHNQNGATWVALDVSLCTALAWRTALSWHQLIYWFITYLLSLTAKSPCPALLVLNVRPGTFHVNPRSNTLM